MEPLVSGEVIGEQQAETQTDDSKRKRRKRTQRVDDAEKPIDPITGDSKEPIQPPVEQPAQAAAAAQERISVPLKDGAIDFGSMRQATKDKFLSAIRSSGVQFQAVPETPAVGAFLSDHLWQLVAGLAMPIASKQFGAENARRVIPFSSGELEQLREPTGRVIDKYAAGLGKYQDEAALLLVLVAIGQQKFQQLSYLKELTAKSSGAANE